MKKKLFTLSNILTCVTFLFTLVSFILYIVNITKDGFFKGVTVPGLVALFIFALLFELLIIGSSLLNLKGILGKVESVVVMVLKVFIPLFLAIGLLNLLSTRIEGIGYIFFSNVDVRKEVATPENIASAVVTFVTGGTMLLSMLLGIVGAYFSVKKEEADQVVAKPVVE